MVVSMIIGNLLKHRILAGLSAAVFSLAVISVTCSIAQAVDKEPATEKKSEKSAAGEILIELNRQEQTDANCRVSFLMKNGLEQAITELALELVIFDENSQVASILIIKSGALPTGKTRVKRYALEGVTCAKVSRYLINDIKQCTGGALTPGACLNRLNLNSRTAATLGI